jgi:hypothetical protein
MPRDGAIIFHDIVGKPAVLRITCDKCGWGARSLLEDLANKIVDHAAKTQDFEKESPDTNAPPSAARDQDN